MEVRLQTKAGATSLSLPHSTTISQLFHHIGSANESEGRFLHGYPPQPLLASPDTTLYALFPSGRARLVLVSSEAAVRPGPPSTQSESRSILGPSKCLLSLPPELLRAVAWSTGSLSTTGMSA